MCSNPASRASNFLVGLAAATAVAGQSGEKLSERFASFSIFCAKLRTPLELSGTLFHRFLRGFMGVHNWASMIPTDASISDSWTLDCCFPSLDTVLFAIIREYFFQSCPNTRKWWGLFWLSTRGELFFFCEKKKKIVQAYSPPRDCRLLASWCYIKDTPETPRTSWHYYMVLRSLTGVLNRSPIMPRGASI